MGKKAHTFEMKTRVDRAEEMLCSGLAPSFIQKVFAGPAHIVDEATGKPAQPGPGIRTVNVGGYDITERQARNIIKLVYERWEESDTADALWRREKNLRMAERLYSKAFSEGQYSAAASALNIIARMTGSMTPPPDPAKAAALKALGPIPDDPVKAALYSQRVLLIELSYLLVDRHIDLEKRVRWMLDIVSRITAAHPKALAGRRVEELESKLQSLAPIDPAQLVTEETEVALHELSERLRAMAESREPEEIDVTPANGHDKDGEDE